MRGFQAYEGLVTFHSLHAKTWFKNIFFPTSLAFRAARERWRFLEPRVACRCPRFLFGCCWNERLKIGLLPEVLPTKNTNKNKKSRQRLEIMLLLIFDPAKPSERTGYLPPKHPTIDTWAKLGANLRPSAGRTCSCWDGMVIPSLTGNPCKVYIYPLLLGFMVLT